ncbi:MAG: C45 family peptidase [Planctomycetota bacterium]
MTEPAPIRITFEEINDARSGSGLERLFASYWPAYRRWIGRAPSCETARAIGALRDHMPELMPVFESLLERFGGGDPVARFLTLFEPPPLVRGCSQIVLPTDEGPVLLRNYDHHPDLFDGVILDAAWGGVGTLAMTDCMWGALDGINEQGLVVALAFGGRHAVGSGFAAPLIVRYLLQTCSDTGQARDALARVPVSMPYTFVVVDADARFFTAFLGPDREPVFVTRRCSANHQGETEWPAYARQTRSRERLGVMESLLAGKPGVETDAARRAFLRPPLWRHDHASASGTLYSAEYHPGERSLSLRWPGQSTRVLLGRTKDRTCPVELPPPPAAED